MTVQTTEETLLGVTVDEAARQRLVSRKTRASRRHVIYFTPRSGSSWLSTAMAETNVLGHAGEYLNPSFLSSIAAAMNANTPETYLDALLRSRKTENDVFTLEITYFHFQRFGNKGLFFRYLSPHSPCVYLMRENIVLQAISLYKAVETQVFHTASAPEDRIAQSRGFTEYDAGKILGWVRHIRQQEIGLEALFAVEKIRPLRLSYERMFGVYADPVALVARHFGVPEEVPPAASRAVAHDKLASSSNLDLEARFRADHREFVDRLDTERAEIVAKLYANGAGRAARPSIRTRVRKADRTQGNASRGVAPRAASAEQAEPAGPPRSLSQDQVLRLAEESLRQDLRFSAIRFGDGEGMFLGGDGSIFPPAMRNDVFKTLFGTVPSVDAVADLGERMKEAYRDADVFGGPGVTGSTNFRWARAAGVVKWLDLRSPSSHVAHTSFHQNVFGSQRLADMIRAAGRVVAITPHPVAGVFRQRFDVDVEWIRVPGEVKFLNPEDRHYPDRFNEVCGILRGEDRRGSLALVGAGFCGKVYCGAFKKAGGVAVDVGSAFDELVGMSTRAYMSKFADVEQMYERLAALPIGEDPYSARVHFFKSLHLDRMGRLDEALEESRANLKLSRPPGERDLFHHHSLLARTGRSDEASLFLHKACSNYPETSADAWQALGDRYFAAGKHWQSAVAFEQGYLLDRTNLLALKRYIAALVRAGEIKEAVRYKAELQGMADRAKEILALIDRIEGEPAAASEETASSAQGPLAKEG